MFKWLKNKYIEYKKKNHISKEQCFVFPIMPKSQLEDGENLNGNEVWSKCIFELTLNDLIKQAENMSEEYVFELTSNIVLFEKKFEDKE